MIATSKQQPKLEPGKIEELRKGLISLREEKRFGAIDLKERIGVNPVNVELSKKNLDFFFHNARMDQRKINHLYSVDADLNEFEWLDFMGLGYEVITAKLGLKQKNGNCYVLHAKNYGVNVNGVLDWSRQDIIMPTQKDGVIIPEKMLYFAIFSIRIIEGALKKCVNEIEESLSGEMRLLAVSDFKCMAAELIKDTVDDETYNMSQRLDEFANIIHFEWRH